MARLLRIDKLINEFKVLVDRGNIKVRSAVDLSYLTEEQQRAVYRLMTEKDVTVIDMKMAKQLREITSSYTIVTDELITDVLNGEYDSDEKPKDRGEKITLPTATYKRYLSSYSKKEANEIIEKALALYFEQGE